MHSKSERLRVPRTKFVERIAGGQSAVRAEESHLEVFPSNRKSVFQARLRATISVARWRSPHTELEVLRAQPIRRYSLRCTVRSARAAKPPSTNRRRQCGGGS